MTIRCKRKYKKPSCRNMNRCMNIRCRTKRGEYVSKDELRFCEEMLKKYLELYYETQKDIFELTFPFCAK